MKSPTRIAAAILAAASLAFLPAALAQSGTVQGEVLEAQDTEGYTYLRLKTKDGETWAAVPTVPSAPVKKGQKVTLVNAMTMSNFESKSLKRKFDRILFAQLGDGAPAAAGQPPSAASASPHPQRQQSAPVPKIAKATGANAKTVAEVNAGKDKLKDKPVTVRGQVVKVNSGIRGKNWLHIQDGSGSPDKGTNDLTVVTTDNASVGDVVTASGTVRTNVNVGQGYSFELLLEDAKVRK